MWQIFSFIALCLLDAYTGNKIKRPKSLTCGGIKCWQHKRNVEWLQNTHWTASLPVIIKCKHIASQH